MGIQGLIPFLKKATRQVNIRDFSGCTVAVDAYCWLHKGAFSCADKLAMGEKTNAYVYYCMKYVNMLLSHNIKPILVFDGQHLPAKAQTESKRRESREKNRRQAAEHLRQGRTSEARECFRRCVDVTPAMAVELMKACQNRNVDCIVAPYEADSQLAYLSLKGLADIIITEDSDLILFGCEKILFKMDLSGNGLLVEKDKLHTAVGMGLELFTFDKFQAMCILSGCDYLPSIPGIGLAKARKFVTRTSNPDLADAVRRLPALLGMPNIEVPSTYANDFRRAVFTFRHQLVFDPQLRKQVPLTPHPDDVDEYLLMNAGTPMSPKKAFQLSLGNLDPFTLTPINNFNPDDRPKPNDPNWWREKAANCKSFPKPNTDPVAPHKSIWDEDYISKKFSPQTHLDRPSTRDLEAVCDIRVVARHSRKRSLSGNDGSLCEEDEEVASEDLLLQYSDSPAKKVKLDVLGDFSVTSKAPQRDSGCFTECDKTNVNIEEKQVVSAKLFNPLRDSGMDTSETHSTDTEENVNKHDILSDQRVAHSTSVQQSPVVHHRNPFVKRQPVSSTNSSVPEAKPFKTSLFISTRENISLPKQKLCSALNRFSNLNISSAGESPGGYSQYFSKTETDTKLTISSPTKVKRETKVKSPSKTDKENLSLFKWSKSVETTVLPSLKKSPVMHSLFKPLLPSTASQEERISPSPNDSGVESDGVDLSPPHNHGTLLSPCDIKKWPACNTKKLPLKDRRKTSACRQPGLPRQQTLLQRFGFSRREAPKLANQ